MILHLTPSTHSLDPRDQPAGCFSMLGGHRLRVPLTGDNRWTLSTVTFTSEPSVDNGGSQPTGNPQVGEAIVQIAPGPCTRVEAQPIFSDHGESPHKFFRSR